MTKIKYINHRRWNIEPKKFQPFILRLDEYIRCWEGVINVIFVDDTFIQVLNKNYRQKDAPTDVLSFNYVEKDPQNPKEVIGEIYISVEMAKHQAKEVGDSLQEELNKLFVHGFLHLHGYDHILDEDYKVMHDLECKILKRNLPFIKNN